MKLQELTVKMLQAKAKEAGIKGYSRMKKDQLIALLEKKADTDQVVKDEPQPLSETMPDPPKTIVAPLTPSDIGLTLGQPKDTGHVGGLGSTTTPTKLPSQDRKEKPNRTMETKSLRDLARERQNRERQEGDTAERVRKDSLDAAAKAEEQRIAFRDQKGAENGQRLLTLLAEVSILCLKKDTYNKEWLWKRDCQDAIRAAKQSSDRYDWSPNWKDTGEFLMTKDKPRNHHPRKKEPLADKFKPMVNRKAA